MSRVVRKCPKEFKQESVKLALSYNNVKQAAEELGIPSATLNEWVVKARSSGEQSIASDDGTINHVNVGEVLNENRELRRRLVRLEQEKAILKKAAVRTSRRS